jgi:hypothetical protein
MSRLTTVRWGMTRRRLVYREPAGGDVSIRAGEHLPVRTWSVGIGEGATMFGPTKHNGLGRFGDLVAKITRSGANRSEVGHNCSTAWRFLQSQLATTQSNEPPPCVRLAHGSMRTDPAGP